MAIKPRKVNRGKTVLTPGRSWFLSTGFFLDGTEEEISDSELKELWRIHKNAIMGRWREEKRAFSRPWAYWEVEHGIDMGFAFDEASFLKENGLVEEWELEFKEKLKGGENE